MAALTTAETPSPNRARSVAKRSPRKRISSTTGVRRTVSQSWSATTGPVPHARSRSNPSVQCAERSSARGPAERPFAHLPRGQQNQEHRGERDDGAPRRDQPEPRAEPEPRGHQEAPAGKIGR